MSPVLFFPLRCYVVDEMTYKNKILPIRELPAILDKIRTGKKVVHCHGVFDLLHIGHIRYIRKAKKLGDVLVVTLTRDEFVNKGPHRPVFEDSIRAEVLASLDFVDFVAISDWPTAVEIIHLLKPDFYAKGAEFRNQKTPEIIKEEKAIESIGGKIVFIEDIVYSSSNLINKYISPFSEEVNQYLGWISERYSAKDLLKPIEKARSLRPLVVGETIVDEYQYCQTLGQSTKDPILSMKQISSDRFASGAMAVANYLSGFCDEVGFLSALGTDGEYVREEQVTNLLKENVKPFFVKKRDSQTIIRRRYSESYFSLPILEVYKMRQSSIHPEDDEAVNVRLLDLAPRYDFVVCADYGLGLMTEAMIKTLSERPEYLAVTVQTNAGNLGYHHISKYPRADYVCLADRDIRLEFREPEGDVFPMIEDVTNRLQAKIMVLTQGKRRCICFRPDEGFVEAPALSTRVLDRAGGNEAFFAVSSLCAYQNVSMDILAFLGHTAGAQAVAEYGMGQSFERLPFCRHVQSLLK